MAKETDDALLDQIDRDIISQPSADKLEMLRDKIRSLRDLDYRIADAEKNLSELKRERQGMLFDTLPTMFMQVGISRVDVQPSGNLPGYEAKLKDHYHAVIPADWPEDKRDKAMKWLHRHKLGDLIKTTLTLEFGLGQAKVVKKVITALKKLKITPQKAETVPWNTLTAVVKERFEGGKPLSDEDLRTINASVQKVVKLSPIKEK